MEPTLSRQLWHSLESLNCVAYFSPEPQEAAISLGLKGFWMGYFAFRAAPLGAVPAGVVEALFYGFHPSRVGRAIPDAWGYCDPPVMVEARSSAAADALRRLLKPDVAEDLAGWAVPSLEIAIEAADVAARPIFAANREIQRPDDPVAVLWNAATTLREHRGDAHVSVLSEAGLTGCESLVLFAVCRHLPGDFYVDRRGWSKEEWDDTTHGLTQRGLLCPDGRASTKALELHAQIERRTDELAIRPYEGLGEERVLALLSELDGPWRRIASSGEIPFPNPMGLPSPQ